MTSDEQDIQKAVARNLESIFDNDEVIQELTSDCGSYRIDVAVPGRDIAIECKASKKPLIKKGIGQALRYEVDGWSSYVCTHDDIIDVEEVEMCMQANIGLIGVGDLDLYGSKKMNVHMQNESKITTTSRGYARSGHNISVPQILDNLGVETIDDIIELQDKLREVEPMEVEEGRYESFGNGRHVLPENS